MAAGEAVIVEYGRRRALGIVLGEGAAPVDVTTKPILSRVRSDGPLLPPRQLELARHIADHYLAPPALVVRAMLPPGLLERLEPVARLARAAARGSPSADGDEGPVDELLSVLADAGDEAVPLAELPFSGGRAALRRVLARLAIEGRLELEWRLTSAAGGPRYERRARLSPAGRDVASLLARGDRLPGPALGARQTALLEELAALPPTGTAPAAPLADRHGAGTLTRSAARGLVVLELELHERRPLGDRIATARPARPPGASLTAEQLRAVDPVAEAIRARRFAGFLLEGSTASGKTSVYLRVIEEALAEGRGAIVLVPEIALAAPLLDRLRGELGLSIALLHSALSEGERADEWRRVRAGDVSLVVGTRMAILAPLADPGLIVVDEEHDAAYKSDRTPRYQGRDLALALGRICRAPVLLGSATPEVATLGRARAGELTHLRLSERLAGRPPSVAVVDLRAELATGNRGVLSASLRHALRALDLDRGERAILVLNRRGSASVVLCRDCGYVQICPECQRPLVYHAIGLLLRCHHCGASAPLARRCPACESPRIRYLGAGTERVEREVRELFPALRVARLDRDVVERKGAAVGVVDAFTEGRLDVLVGTSLVTKGLDVPQVTLVGVVSADVALNLPDERAAERTFQLLVQAVGRAGRGERPGQAIIQTYLPDHPVIRAVATGEHGRFYEAELAARRRFGSPPYGALIKLTVALEDRARATAEAERLATELRERASGSAGSQVLGPVPAYVARRAGRWRFNVVLRGRDPLALLGGDPGPPWSVDVDPESLL